MRHSVLRWICGAGVVAAVGTACTSQPPAPAGAGPAGRASVTAAAAVSPTPAPSASATRSAVQSAPQSAAAIAAVQVPPRPRPYSAPTVDLRLGSKGAAVASVQRRLAQLGYYPGPVDGKYGNDLLEAVWAFKEVQGLPLNGGSSLINAAFRTALVVPKPPKVLVPGGGADRIEINQSIQVLVLYSDNKPSLILHVSTGGRYYYCDHGSCGYAVTPDGNYTALSYLQGDIRVPLGFMENPVFFIGRAYAIHGGDAVPWYPASHGCVRIYDDAVDWFHTRVHLGVTKIYVRGTAPAYL